jgi:membrane-associated PAP2 superfamily phosphatase
MQMISKRLLYLVLLIVSPVLVWAQQTDTLLKKLDSLTKKSVDEGKQKNVILPGAYNETTKITFKTYFVLLGSDFKQQITSPFHFDAKSWTNVGAVALITGGIALVDEPIQKAAFKGRKSQTLNNISRYVTNTGGLYEVYTLVGLGTYGFLFKNEKMKTTTFLATQSYITAATIETLVKFITGRQRPSYIDPIELDSEPRFRGPFNSLKDANGKSMSSSFPSGHTTVAFAAATVFAKEYANKPIIPIISYTAASLIGLSRITENKHWASDVFAGAVLGYFCGKQVVNNYHRYAKIGNDKVHKNRISLNFNYFNGAMMPGLVYKP